MLVVEDVHWADDATLDVLRYVGRRIDDLPALLVVTYRDDEIAPTHPLRHVLGALGGAGVRRLRLERLSRTAVARLSGGTTVTSAGLFRYTGGNPFFVTEALAAPGAGVPATVVDAVLARVRRLSPPAQAALDLLAVVPSGVELPLARGLLGELTPLAEAERHGVLEVRADAVAFRHELARRAVEGSLPSSTRMELNARVLATLPGFPGADPARMVHHAVAAGNGAAVVAFAPAAARRANRAGAHAQEVALYAAALEQPLDAPERADMLQASAQALFAMDRVAEAALAAVEAVRIREERSEPGPLAEALTTLAPIEWARYRPAGALATAMRAVELLESDGDSPRRAFALAYAGLLLVAIDRYGESLPLADAAVAMARRLRAAGLEALGLALRGGSRLMLGDDEGLVELEAGVRMGAAVPDHATVMIGYVLAVEDLWALGRFADVERFVEAGLAYSRERDLGLYVEHLQAHRLRLSALRGDWAGAEDGLAALQGEQAGAETAAERYSLPALAQLLVRRGADDAGSAVDRAYDLAVRSDSLLALVPAAAARIEHAWLTGRPDSPGSPPSCFADGSPRPVPSAAVPSFCASCVGSASWSTPSRVPRGVCRRPSRRLVGRSGGVGTSRRSLRPRPRVGRLRRGRTDAGSAARARRAGCPAGRRCRPEAAAGPGRDGGAARPAVDDPHEPGWAHRPPGRDPPAGRPRPDQRRDRRPAGRVRAYRRPPRVGRVAEARRREPARRRRGGRSARPGVAAAPSVRGATLINADESAGRPRRQPSGCCRGKSGLRRAGWLSTATRGDPRDSATENRPPRASSAG